MDIIRETLKYESDGVNLIVVDKVEMYPDASKKNWELLKIRALHKAERSSSGFGLPKYYSENSKRFSVFTETGHIFRFKCIN